MQRAGWLQVAAFVLLGVAYPALYFVAFAVSAVASLGGGGTSFELVVQLGLCAAIFGAVVAGVMLYLLRRSSPRAPWRGSLVAWIVWVLVTGASMAVVEPIWQTSRLDVLLLIPPVLNAVASIVGVVISVRVARKGRADRQDARIPASS